MSGLAEVVAQAIGSKSTTFGVLGSDTEDEGIYSRAIGTESTKRN